MNPADVAIAARNLLGAVPGIKVAYEYDEEQLQGVPALTLSLARTDPRDRFTGPAQEHTWTWIVRLYLPYGGRVAGSDSKALNDLQYDLLPRLFKVLRDHPDLDGACLKAALGDPGEEPDLSDATDTAVAVKLLTLTAVTEEV